MYDDSGLLCGCCALSAELWQIDGWCPMIVVWCVVVVLWVQNCDKVMVDVLWWWFVVWLLCFEYRIVTNWWLLYRDCGLLCGCCYLSAELWQIDDLWIFVIIVVRDLCSLYKNLGWGIYCVLLCLVVLYLLILLYLLTALFECILMQFSVSRARRHYCNFFQYFG
jgi:hypothetical protein